MSLSPNRSDTTNDHDVGKGGAGNLPEDLVFKLLTRVPLNDLTACRVVSSRWRSITYEPTSRATSSRAISATPTTPTSSP
nr:hypothetical protein [Zea mays]